MGCVSSDFVPSNCAETNNALMKANEGVIKALICKYCHERRFGIVVKLLNISRLIRGYYDQLRSQRSFVLSRLGDLSEEATADINKQLVQERKELIEANDALLREYRRLTDLSMLSSAQNEIHKWITALSTDHILAFDFNNVKKKYRNAQELRRSLDDLVMEVNAGQPLTSEEHAIIKRIASVTTYKFTGRTKSLQYSIPESSPRRRRRRTHQRSATTI